MEPNRLFKGHQRASDAEQGATALEFTLMLPVFLILLLGTISIGHGMVVRYLLNSAAYDAARACALQRLPTSACANTVVKKKLGTAVKWCAGSPKVTATNAPNPDLDAVRTLEVNIDCSYGGIIASSYLQTHGLWIKSIRAKAAMPY
jgi:Flp pilus assembly protein TadG